MGALYMAAIVTVAACLVWWLNDQDKRAHEPDPTPVHHAPTVRVIPPVFDFEKDT